MKLGGVLTTVLLLAAPVAAGAQGHGAGAMGHHAGMGQFVVAHGAWHGGAGGHGFDHHGPGPDFRGHVLHDHFFHDRLHDRFVGAGWWWGPYWGWSDCGAYADACDWGGENGPGAPSDDYGYTNGPSPEAACGAWMRRGAGYAWTRRACADPPAADPPVADPPHAAVAANECSDWVWRADLRRSVCKRGAHATG